MLNKLPRLITTTNNRNNTKIKFTEQNSRNCVVEYICQELKTQSTRFITISLDIDYTDGQMAAEGKRAGYNWNKAKEILYNNTD